MREQASTSDVPADARATAIEPSRDNFGARTPWTPGPAIAYTIFALLLAAGASILLQAMSFRLSRWLMTNHGAMPADHVTLANTMLTTLVLEAVTILVVLWGAGRGGGNRRRVLSLPSRLPLQTLLLGLAAMTALVVPINLAKFLLWPSAFSNDLSLYAAAAGTPALWLAAIVVTFGAPVSEELLLRGFLLPALAKGRQGFKGAAVITTAFWTLLHFNYTLTGLIEIFSIGLLFCWLLHRTGNLWLTIVLHGFYNALQLVAVAVWPRALGL